MWLCDHVEESKVVNKVKEKKKREKLLIGL